LVLADTAVQSCTEEWTPENGAGFFGRLVVDGTGSAVDVLYLRSSVGLELFNSASVLNTPQNPTRIGVAETSVDYASTDRVYGTALGQVVLGSSGGLSVLSAGPWLSLGEGLEQPVTVTETVSTFTVSLSSDIDVSSVWYDTASPYNSSASGNPSLSALTAGTASTVTLDTSLLSGLSDGVNTVFIYATDADGNLGWTSLRINLIPTPSPVENFELRYGNERLYLVFDAPSSDDGVTDYEILLSTEAFTPPEDTTSLPTGWSAGTPGFTVSSVTYPNDDDGEWPMSLDYASFSSDSETSTETDSDTAVLWSQDGTQLIYILYPLENGTEYFVSIRARSESVLGGWSEVLSATPAETCDASCLAENAGGFCSLVPDAGLPVRGRGNFPWWAVLVPMAGLLRRRRLEPEVKSSLQ
jgi:hypothetical protein